MTKMLRGQVWEATLDAEVGPKLWVIVSQNGRNRHFDTALGVRITTTNRHDHLPSVVPLPDGECVNGWIAGDSLTEIWDEDCNGGKPKGSLSRPAMEAVEEAVRGALGML